MRSTCKLSVLASAAIGALCAMSSVAWAQPAPASPVMMADGNAAGANSVSSLDFTATGPTSIPDNNATGVDIQIPVGAAFCVGDLNVSVNISHTFRGDITIDLISPMGTTVRLHNRSGGSADNIVRTYDQQRTVVGSLRPDGPGSLDDFNAEPSIGTWILRISDRAQLDFGTFNSATLFFAASTTACPPVAFNGTASVGAFFDPSFPTSVGIDLQGESPLQTPVGFAVTSLPQFVELSVFVPSGSRGTTGSVGDIIILTSGDLPFSLPGTSNAVTYSPNLGYIGADSFTFKAQDSNGMSEPATVTIDVGTPEVAAAWSMDVNPGWTFEGLWSWGVPAGLDGDPDSGLNSLPRGGSPIRTPVVGYNLGNAPGNIDLATSVDLEFDRRGGGGGANLGVRRNDGKGDFGAEALFAFDCLEDLISFDINADGLGDLVLFDDCGDGTLAVRYALEGGGFGPQQQTPPLNVFCPSEPIIADFNGDQTLDIGLRDFCSVDNFVVLLNDGQGSFTRVSSFIDSPCLSDPQGSGDLDADGDLDLLYVDFCTSQLIVAFNNGAGAFTRVDFNSVIECSSVRHVGDLNGDGSLDVIVQSFCGGTSSLQAFLNSGAGTFTPGVAFAQGLPLNEAIFVDIDNDSVTDVIADEYCQTEGCEPAIKVFLNDGDAGFTQDPTTYPLASPFNGTELATADLNDDGAQDLIVVEDGPATLSVFRHRPIASGRGPGGGSEGFFFSPESYPIDPCFDELLLADLNDDSAIDILTTSYCGQGTLTSYINDGLGEFTVGEPSDARAECPGEPLLVDLDGQPGLDAILVDFCFEQILAFTNDGDGNFSAGDIGYFVPINFNGDACVEELASGDFNADGLTDIIMLDDCEGAVYVVFDASENSQFEINFRGDVADSIYVYEFIDCPDDVTVADFNNDGLLDFAVTDNCDSALILFINDEFEPGYFYDEFVFGGKCPGSLASGDLNNDGRADLVVYDDCEGEFLVLLNNFFDEPTEEFAARGSGFFGEPLFFDAGSDCLSRLRLADVNGDDLLDIISADFCANGLVVYLNEAVVVTPDTRGGELFFSSRPEFFPIEGDCLDHIEVADLNEDALPDIVVLDCDSNMGRVEILFNAWQTTTSRMSSLSLEAGGDPEGLVLTDLNDDGLTDIAVANEDSNDLSVFLNLGGGSFGPQTRYSTGGSPSGLVAGRFNSGGVSSDFNDSNNDGEADGLYQNSLAAPLHATTTSIDLSNYVRTTLEFQRWLGVEESRFDNAAIQISTDGGKTWQTIWSNADAEDDIVETEWTSQSYDISAFADGQSDVRIRWSMGPTDSSVAFFGWNLDDVVVKGVFAPVLVPVVQGDADRNGVVNFDDLTTVLSNFGATYLRGDTAMGDADANGTVNFDDLTAVLSNFGAGSTAR